MESHAQLNTSVQVIPARSQVVLVSFILLAAICLLSGFAFLWENKQFSWIPLGLGTIISCSVVFAWFKAQKDTDLENAKPTIMQDGSGNQITTDTRALASPESVQNMERLFSVLKHREPLPEPDGLIDSSGNPIPSSQREAIDRVNAANNEAQQLTNIAIEELGIENDAEIGIQPLLDEPYSEQVVKTNVGKT
ncbi:MAG: hypothetical protein KZQ96_20025 [Candidatus Thiodiazotropha sp. (ex Lucinoma borealis)]|nr:hypothetical protein [Candidatus Thiodiazotropha sp. (ex Lucinoma borealis)]